MTNDVIVTVKGVQLGMDQSDEIEVINVGKYNEKNGKIYIRYDEQQEGVEGIVSNMIKIDGKQVEISKKGAVGVQMIFREGEQVNSCYETPYGMLMMGIYTNEVQCTVAETCIELKLSYSIEMNGEFLSDANVHIKVEPQGSGMLHLI
ncbi:MAG: DUF1934 domain-containing protein [Lachnospiraceae bacterium]